MKRRDLLKILVAAPAAPVVGGSLPIQSYSHGLVFPLPTVHEILVSPPTVHVHVDPRLYELADWMKSYTEYIKFKGVENVKLIKGAK